MAVSRFMASAGAPVHGRRRRPCSVPWHRIPDPGFRIDPLSYARAGAGSPGSADQPRPISRSIGGYTIRCRNGLIAAM